MASRSVEEDGHMEKSTVAKGVLAFFGIKKLIRAVVVVATLAAVVKVLRRRPS